MKLFRQALFAKTAKNGKKTRKKIKNQKGDQKKTQEKQKNEEQGCLNQI